MRQSLFMLSYLVLLFSLFFNCKNESQIEKEQQEVLHSIPTATKKNEENKPIVGLVKVQIDGKSFRMTDFDQELTTDVTYLDNGVQFRIEDINKQTVLVNMYAPGLLQKIPITIAQQSSALDPEEAFSVKTQSRLEINIPSESPVQGDVKVLYEGTVSLEELTNSKLVVTFMGKGFSLGSNKKELFPMQGEIVLENFNVYDARMNNPN